MAITQLNDAKRPYTAYIQTANFRDQEEGMFPFTYWLAYAYEFGDINAVSEIEIEVPPGAIVLQVGHQISEALTDCTDIEIGDDDDPNGWVADAYDAGATGFYTDYTAAYAAAGKRYNTGDTIDVHFTGVVSAGSGKVFVKVLSYTEVLTGS